MFSSVLFVTLTLFAISTTTPINPCPVVGATVTSFAATAAAVSTLTTIPRGDTAFRLANGLVICKKRIVLRAQTRSYSAAEVYCWAVPACRTPFDACRRPPVTLLNEHHHGDLFIILAYLLSFSLLHLEIAAEEHLAAVRHLVFVCVCWLMHCLMLVLSM